MDKGEEEIVPKKIVWYNCLGIIRPDGRRDSRITRSSCCLSVSFHPSIQHTTTVLLLLLEYVFKDDRSTIYYLLLTPKWRWYCPVTAVRTFPGLLLFRDIYTVLSGHLHIDSCQLFDTEKKHSHTCHSEGKFYELIYPNCAYFVCIRKLNLIEQVCSKMYFMAWDYFYSCKILGIGEKYWKHNHHRPPFWKWKFSCSERNSPRTKLEYEGVRWAVVVVCFDEEDLVSCALLFIHYFFSGYYYYTRCNSIYLHIIICMISILQCENDEFAVVGAQCFLVILFFFPLYLLIDFICR